jgi:hypothetical protein
MGGKFWTMRASKGWAVKKEGATRISSIHSSQADAWAEARRLARGSDGDAVLKDTDGHIRARNAYGRGPFSQKG